MPVQPRVDVVFEAWGEVAAQFAAESAELCHETALRILAQSVANAAEDTGALKASHYIVDAQGSTYADAVSAAQGKNADVEILPEVSGEPNAAIVAVAVAHGEAAEYYSGPVNPGAHPYLTPAAEGERPAFEAAVAALGGRIR